MPLLDKLNGLFQSGSSKLVDSIGNALDKNISNKEELAKAKLEFEKELNRHLESIKTNAKEITLAELKDMDSARNREVQIATSDKAPLINKIILPILAAFVTFGFFGILAYMLLYEIPQANKDVLNIMLGSLGTAWIGIIFYYFGSSSGSASKQKQLDKIMND